METLKCIQTRRSIRQYKNQTISDKDLKNNFNRRDVCTFCYE